VQYSKHIQRLIYAAGCTGAVLFLAAIVGLRYIFIPISAVETLAKYASLLAAIVLSMVGYYQAYRNWEHVIDKYGDTMRTSFRGLLIVVALPPIIYMFSYTAIASGFPILNTALLGQSEGMVINVKKRRYQCGSIRTFGACHCATSELLSRSAKSYICIRKDEYSELPELFDVELHGKRSEYGILFTEYKVLQ